MKTQEPRTIHLKDYKPSPYVIDHASLDVRLDPTATEVAARLSLRRNPLAATEAGAPLVLDGEKLKLLGVAVDGATLAEGGYEAGERSLTILRPPAEPFTLDVKTICDPEANKALSGLYRAGQMYCTQCEPEGFRHITYYIDRPDVLATFRVRIEADASEVPVLLANGNPAGTGQLPGGRHYAIWEDPHPKPSYLFAMVGGKLGVVTGQFTTASGRKVELRVYCEPGKEDRCHWAMECLKASMRWDEERFGLEYDLDIFMIVAVSSFNMGAMENKGLNIFNDALILARPDTATDGSYEAIEAVIAHEYFHNWTGNRITCRDWFQLCLKEGLTVFRDQEFTSDVRSRDVARIENVLGLRTRQFAEDGGPLAHPVRPASFIEINNFYTATVYEKGAELCRMIMMIVGADGFRKGINLYFQRHDGTAATVEDFVAAMADANNVNLAQFMLWYSQAGTPGLTCRFTYSTKNKAARLTVRQEQKPTPGQQDKRPLHIPFKVGLLDPHGKEIELKLDDGASVKDGILHLRKRSESFTFTGIDARPVPSLLREFSAPVNLTANLNSSDLEFLVAHDSDSFTRWQSARTLAMNTLIAMTATIREGRKPRPSPRYAKAMARVLTDGSLDPAFRALMLVLPSAQDVALEIGADVDPAAIFQARKIFSESLARALCTELEQLYGVCVAPEPYSPDPKSVGLRSLRNAAMSLLSATGKRADIQRVRDHYAAASNMTDMMSALRTICASDSPARHELLEVFYERWQDEPLVLDMWFSTQAVSRHSTAERVRELMRHPKFSLQNPNRMRSVIGSFAWGNVLHFHAADGSGYRLVTDAVLEINKFNPLMAARLLTSFETWRMLEEMRRNAARAELERVATAPDLSRDVYEIVTKTLS